MKLKIILPLIISSVLIQPTFAQKDLPVCGNAAALVDLLKKDYNAIDPDTRREEMSRDVTMAIAIFKSYLIDDQRRQLPLEKSTPSYNRNQKYQDWVLIKKQVAAYTTMSTGNLRSAKEADTASNNLKKLSASLETAKNEYFDGKYNIDSAELSALAISYKAHDNQFLSFVIDRIIEKYGAVNKGLNDQFSTANPSSEIQKGIPFSGGDLAFPTAQTLIDGLSKFIANRLKEEMTSYVMDRVRIWLQNPSQDDPLAEFKVLLPRTTAFLIGFTPDKIANFPKEIRQYISDDVDHLLSNAQNLRNTPRLQRLLASHPDLDFAFDALETVPNISKIKTPQDYFAMLEKSRGLAGWKTSSNETKHNVAHGILLTSLLAHSLAVNDNGEQKLASVSFLSTYGKEKDFFYLYTGFLRQQNRKYYDISFNHNRNTDFLLDDGLSILVGRDPKIFTTIDKYKDLIDDILNRAAKNAEKIYTVGQDIKKANQAGKKIGADTIFTFVDNIIGFSSDLVKSADEFNNLMISEFNVRNNTTLQPLNLNEKTATYFAMANSSNQIMRDLNNKKYADALLKTLDLASSVVSQGKLGNLSKTLQQLRAVGATPASISWHNVIAFTIKNQTVTGVINLDAQLVNDLNIVQAEMAKLDLYCKVNDPGGTFEPVLAGIKDECSRAILSGNIPATGIADVRAFLNRPDFQQFLLSYATSLALDKLMADIAAEMHDFKVSDRNGNDVDLFSQTDIEHLTFATGQYISAIFDNYYLKGLKDEGDDLKTKRVAVFSTITSYLALLPQRFDFAANTQLVSLVHFVNDMAAAQNSDDVEKAIEAFALPSGSYAIKRQSVFNFTVNSYPGIFSAAEFTSGKPVPSIGFTAPVGFGLAWGSKDGAVNGLFIPIIDIGALTRLRLDNSDKTPALPEFTFKNIFSPGIFYSHGFGKSPLAFNAGIQYGPQLQDIDSNNMPVLKDCFRFGIALVFDIPLFNLQTRPR